MLTLKKIISVFLKIKYFARKSLSENNFNKSLKYISTASKVAYNFNWIYTDEELELMLKEISSRNIKKQDYTIIRGRYVFYDAFGWDNRGLTQQYIRALMSWGADFLYIFENEDPKQSQAIRTELETYSKCMIFSIDPKLASLEKIQSAYKMIIEYAPEKAFLHLAPWSVEAVTVFYALPEIIKYQINLTDHAFWLGTGCIDYSIEFRDYGCTVSREKRGLRNDQLLLHPYYPIVNKNTFLGFPQVNTAGRVIVFSGGGYYKIYGKDGVFFDLIKRLLKENPSIIILFAGSGNSRPLEKFIKQNELENRFILLGHRRDINEVFSNCDVYLGTYPLCGGLMSQYAAINGKSILAYTSEDIPSNYVEGIVCHNSKMNITHTDLNEFFEEAHRLCNDEKYRNQIGAELQKCVITESHFNESLYQLLTSNINIVPYNDVKIDYDAFMNLYIDIENKYLDSFKLAILSNFGVKSFILFPGILLRALPELIVKYWDKMYKIFT